MKKAIVVWICLSVLSVSGQAEDTSPKETVLFDFEGGAEGWTGNPWKGGKCLFEITNDARFGQRALRGWYAGTPKKDGGNIIGPYLPEDAEWRKQDWEWITFWARGDGSASSIKLILEEDAAEHPTFSKPLPLDSKEWQRFSFRLSSFWNRGKRKINPASLKRLYFGGTPEQCFTIDRIALEAPHREVPIEQVGQAGDLPFETPMVLEYKPGEYGIKVIPPPKSAEKSVEGAFSLATEDGAKGEKRFRLSLDPCSDEMTVFVGLPIKRDTNVSLRVAAKGSSGKEYSAQFKFPVFVSEPYPAESPLSIWPMPKEAKLRDGFFPITQKTAIAADGPRTEEMGWCVDLLRAEMKKWHALDMREATSGTDGEKISLKLEDAGLPEEGYLLDVAPQGVRIRAKDCRGIIYGIQTFLQVTAYCTESPSQPRARCVEIRDWPSLPVRSARIGLPTEKWGYPNDPEVNVDDFLDFLYNTMSRGKYNTLVLEMSHGYRYQCAPKVGAKHAWGRAELEKIRDFCKRRFIEIIPCVNSMGHTGWLLLGYPELRWHDDMHMLCTCNPESYRMLTSIYDELIEIFRPRIFHIGMDEVRWEGNPKNPNPQPCGCDSVPTWEQYGRWVAKLYGHLKGRGIRTMMWGDMLLPDHNGGPPFFTQRALPRIPRDVMMANWSLGTSPLSNVFFNRDCGFPTVIQSNSCGVNSDQAPYIVGNMFGMWNKRGWISQTDAPSSQQFCYLGLVQGAEFSWNLNRSGKDVCKSYDAEYLKSREQTVLKSLAMLPEPGAGKETMPIDISSVANSNLTEVQAGGEVTLSRIRFALMPGGKCVEVRPGESKSLPMDCRAASLYFLHADELPADKDKMNSFVDRWKSAENIWGIPVGRYEMLYEDGSTEEMPIKHSWNILPRRMTRTLPYAYRVIGSWRLEGDCPSRSNALYAAQWVNPRPEKRIKEVRIIAGDTGATVRLFAITARIVK